MATGVASVLPALAEASRTVGSPQIRNRGTLGGNIGTCSPAGDALPPLVALGGEGELASERGGGGGLGGGRGERTLPLLEFMLGPKRSALAADELIVAVRVDARPVPQTFL